MYQVYVKSDEQNRITAINSSAFLSDTTGWTQIDEGIGDKYHHAQGHYFDKLLHDEHYIPRYKLVDGVPAERTQAEIDADVAAIPAPPAPTDTESRLSAAETTLQTHDDEINEIVTGLETLANG